MEIIALIHAKKEVRNMASSSVWKDNTILRKWLKKYSLDFLDGNFNYDLTDYLSDPLLNALAKKLNIDKEYIYLGAGSSQIITNILNLKVWNKIFITSPEFGLYDRNLEKNSINHVKIECITTVDFVNKLSSIKSTEEDLLCLSSPRWFSGERFSDEQIYTILQEFKGTILVDEAYIAYSDNEKGLIDLAINNARIILLRSFSKTYFASGFRIGYIITTKKIDGLRDTFIAPHSISTCSARFATSLINDDKLQKIFSNTRKLVNKNRDIIYDNLKNNGNFNVIKSEANFITLIFQKRQEFSKCYELLKDLPGIQKFDNNITFIKIWISNKEFSLKILKRLEQLK